MRNAGLDEVQAGIKIARRNLNNLRYTDDTVITNIITKQFEFLFQELPKCDRDTKASKCYWKNGTNRLGYK